MSSPPQHRLAHHDIAAPLRGPGTLESVSAAIDIAAEVAAAGRRTVLGLVGPPGAGKSTVGEEIVRALGGGGLLVPMDGFHMSQPELRHLGRRDRMGAPDTFDVAGLAELLRRLRGGEDEVLAPSFDRDVEEPVSDAISVPVDVPLVIVEGNYLLHDKHGWDRIAPLLDACWYLEVPSALRQDRLVRRRIAHGDDPAHSVGWVTSVDERNARTVEATRRRAHRILTPGETR